MAKGFTKFIFVNEPVTQSGDIIITFPEPSIVHHDHIYAEISGFNCKPIDILTGKIKIASFPAVEKNRPVTVTVSAPADMFPDTFMKIVG